MSHAFAIHRILVMCSNWPQNVHIERKKPQATVFQCRFDITGSAVFMSSCLYMLDCRLQSTVFNVIYSSIRSCHSYHGPLFKILLGDIFAWSKQEISVFLGRRQCLDVIGIFGPVSIANWNCLKIDFFLIFFCSDYKPDPVCFWFFCFGLNFSCQITFVSIPFSK